MSLNSTTNDIPYGYCHCGCGKPTPIARINKKSAGWVKGEPLQFRKGHRRPRPIENRFWKKVDKSGNCWLWTGYVMADGYGIISINGKMILAHRYSYELHNGPIPEGMCVCHNCPGADNPACINPAHLWLGTHTDNMQDKQKKNRRGRAAKLSESDVIEIRSRYAKGNITQKELAAEYGVCPTNIGCIVRRATWQLVP